MDKISLQQMEFFGYHGVIPEENRLGQRFVVDLDCHMDLVRAGSSDRVEDTVNYSELYKSVKEIVEGKPVQLIETLAAHIASAVLDGYTKVNEVTVRVTKPHPPFDIHFDGVYVEISRCRHSS